MRVVVTRPQPQAVATASRLREHGFEAIILPLTAIVAIPTTDFEPSAVSCIAVTSGNALRHANADLLQRLHHLPLFAVGNRTADEARKAGFSKVLSAIADAGALASLVAEHTGAGDRVLYLCGATRRPEFESALAHLGRSVLAIETYETQMLVPEPNAAAVLKSADVVLVYAQSAALALNEIGVSGSSAAFVCISERVGQALRVPVANVRVAIHPDEASMLAEIDRLP